MRITQWGEYATHFCIYFARIAEKNDAVCVTATEVAKEYDIDQLYAQQILQRLRKANIIYSVRGAQGGYKLSKSSEVITLKDILSAAEGDTFEMICDSKPIDKERCSPTTDCSVRGLWQDLKTHIDSFLQDKTLKSLLEEKSTDTLIQIGRIF